MASGFDRNHSGAPSSAEEEWDSCGLLILLVRHRDIRSRMGTTVTRGVFSHASLGFESDPETFYSFAYKGFRVENTGFLVDRTPDARCRIYRIPCSGKEEASARKLVSSFLEMRSSLKYNVLGLILASFRIPLARRNRFFCSQFVASVLNQARGIGTKRWARTCLPDELVGIAPSVLLFDGVARDLPAPFALA